jgi:hypothetical protein
MRWGRAVQESRIRAACEVLKGSGAAETSASRTRPRTVPASTVVARVSIGPVIMLSAP